MNNDGAKVHSEWQTIAAFLD